jgi:hypothetical protein
MTSVFVGGSRAISRLNAVIRERLDSLLQRPCLIFIGDANGADKMVQQYLAERDYRDVVVYCMSRCRNNVGSWPIKKVASDSKTKDFTYYAAKDLAMVQAAKCGVMLWDGASRGTLNNIQNLIGAGKQVLVYLSTSKTFIKLTSQKDLEALLLKCDPRVIAEAQERISRKLSPVHQMTLAPHS